MSKKKSDEQHVTCPISILKRTHVHALFKWAKHADLAYLGSPDNA